MHIEPGVVQGAKLLLSVGTALTAGSLVLRQSWRFLVQHGLSTLLSRTICTSVLVFFFFEILPSSPVGVSEVHLILGSTLFLLFGLVPTALGLAIGTGTRSPADTVGSTSVWNECYDLAASTPCGFYHRRADHPQADCLPRSELRKGSAVVACLPGWNCQLGRILGLLWPGIW
jgi:hypothetical protein